jgi:hypothetical protein
VPSEEEGKELAHALLAPMRRHMEAEIYNQEGPHQNPTMLVSHLKSPGPRTLRNKFVLFISQSVYFYYYSPN